ncbi:hypothetical protein [Longimicrobium terrae]|uniref:Uncharacterized protein n=1 Tax=Longimicrobium terrae TaxID=1639882 RepID=A0A841GPD6_9BACT|nr:hypothetical protein [Longimicrobium terrae]MBB4634310.1 hypothetical protein [Longimicrobium terrae]MBB6068800.1 hypothetical protein [Longimicrobium terrae]NNC27985.1 hypothetical protein [Longimicrobium terrae]
MRTSGPANPDIQKLSRIRAGLLVIAIPLALGFTAPARGQTVCPSGDADQPREAVRFFFEELPELATQAGVAHLDPAGLRLLTDTRDSVACQRFRSEVRSPELTHAPWRHMMYELGGYYFEVFYIVTGPDEIALYRTPFRVRDAQMNVLLATLM